MFMEIFEFELGPFEMALRGSIIYWFLFFIARVIGRRELSSVSVADLLIVVLVADAAGDAMSGGSESLSDGLVVVSTILFWGAAIDRLSYFFPRMERVLSPPKRCIIKNGKLQRRIMREQFITLDELRSEMRLKDIEHLSEVENAYVEPSGELSFFRKEKQD